MALRKSLLDPSGRVPLRDDWRTGLPELRDPAVTLRELRLDDAAALVAHLHKASVLQYIARCPATIEGFERFIRWTHTERHRGAFACYGIVPAGHTAAVGIIEFWPIEPDFSTAEWGFALGDAFWGTGLFLRAARLALDAVFDRLGIHRLEARAVDVNVLGNRALAKLGARREGLLRDGFRSGADIRDHVMWSILATEWQRQRTPTRHAN